MSLSIIAYILPIGLFVFVLWRQAYAWRQFAARYGHDDVIPTTEKFGWLVLSRGWLPYQSYNGIVVVGVKGDILTLRIRKPFHFFHTPLAIPFSDISTERTRWYLNDRSYKLTTRLVTDFNLTMPEEIIRWIEQKSGRRLIAASVNRTSYVRQPVVT